MNESISLTALNEMFDHNYWARDRQMQVCSTLTPEQLLQPLGGSFASLRDTLVHMVAVEWIWLERWRGHGPQSLLQPQEFPDISAIKMRWDHVENEMRAYLKDLDNDTLERPVTCVSTRGYTWTYALWRMMLHLLNHQSYHRGQVTTLLRQLGVQPAKVDFLDALDNGFRLS
jgi:uncharacterized damage-inducible protein DinB